MSPPKAAGKLKRAERLFHALLHQYFGVEAKPIIKAAPGTPSIAAQQEEVLYQTYFETSSKKT